MPLSNPTSACEATPVDVVRWSDGRAIVATGSPFDDVEVDGRTVAVGQANNVFIFPGLGLGAIAAEARTITDRMFLVAARTLAAAVTDERLASGGIYPPVDDLRAVTRGIAIAVAQEAIEAGVARVGPDETADALVDGAMWWPAYVPYRAGPPDRAPPGRRGRERRRADNARRPWGGPPGARRPDDDRGPCRRRAPPR